MVETDAPRESLLPQPVLPGGFQQGESAHDIGLYKLRRSQDGAVDVRFGGKMHDQADFVLS